MRTNATPTNMYRYIFLVKAAPKQANAEPRDIHFDSMGYDFNIAVDIKDIAINSIF